MVNDGNKELTDNDEFSNESCACNKSIVGRRRDEDASSSDGDMTVTPPAR